MFKRKNKNSVPSFTQDFHYLTALIQHLGAHEKWNSRTPRNIADSLGMDINEVERVLRSYPAFFRRSGNLREGANKQVISSQADSLIKISRIWADFFPANTSNQP
ncbi:hypothetical protein ABQ327_21610, partial [Enterobacter hormaechei]